MQRSDNTPVGGSPLHTERSNLQMHVGFQKAEDKVWEVLFSKRDFLPKLYNDGQFRNAVVYGLTLLSQEMLRGAPHKMIFYLVRLLIIKWFPKVNFEVGFDVAMFS